MGRACCLARGMRMSLQYFFLEPANSFAYGGAVKFDNWEISVDCRLARY